MLLLESADHDTTTTVIALMHILYGIRAYSYESSSILQLFAGYVYGCLPVVYMYKRRMGVIGFSLILVIVVVVDPYSDAPS